MNDFWKDIRYSLVMLLRRKNRLLGLAAILSLAVGIGANTAIFTLINAFFLRSLPVDEPERLIAFYATFDQAEGRYFPLSFPDFEDYRDNNDAFSGLLATRFMGTTLAFENTTEQIVASAVSGNFFELLGVDAAIGRTLTPEVDTNPGGHPVIVLGHGLWTRLFASDPDIVGREVTINRHPFTVIGVAQQGFKGTGRAEAMEAWIPLSMFQQVAQPGFAAMLPQRSGRLLNVIGRLAPGVELDQARGALQGLATRLAEEYPQTNKGWGLTLLRHAEIFTDPARRGTQLRARTVLAVGAGMVLLLACVNLGTLLLARAAERQREIAIRLSIGAGRGRLIRQLLTESLALGLLGGLVGLAVAKWGVQFLWSIRPPNFLEGSLDLSLDSTVLLFALTISLLTAVLVGLVPIFQALKLDLVSSLKTERTPTGGNRRWTMRNLLIVGQISLCLVCLVGAALFLTSLNNAYQIETGFKAEKLILGSIQVGRADRDESQSRALVDRILEKLNALPGVENATLGEVRLLNNFGFLSQTYFEGQENPDDGVLIRTNYVADDYLETIGTPLVKGRSFGPVDHAESQFVAIVNETMAQRYWPGDDAVGKRIRLDDEEFHMEVVGVARDAKYVELNEEPQPYIYMPFSQRYSSNLALYIRTQGKPEALIPAIRREVREIDPDLPLQGLRPVNDVIKATLWATRMGVGLLGFFGVLALILAAIGVYGVTSTLVQQRRPELGMRMALGAQRLDVAKLLLKELALVVGVGLAVGLIGTLVANRTVESLLYGLESGNRSVIIWVVLFLG
ncbi:MAG: ABC transporter permease, partial [Acidobacteriota bacterium]